MKPVTMYIMATFHLALILCAFTLPKVFAAGEEPLAAGATVVLTIMGFFGLAGLVALLMIVVVIRQRKTLKTPALIAGVAPAVISVLAIVGLAMMIQMKKARDDAKRRAAMEATAEIETREAPVTLPADRTR
jgi:chromate transport protein ChrA